MDRLKKPRVLITRGANYRGLIATSQALQPRVGGSLKPGGESYTLGVRIFSAESDEQGQTGCLIAESHRISVLPQVPATEEGKSRSRAFIDGRRGIVGMEEAHPHTHREATAEPAPELPGEGALEEDVLRRLEGGTAERAHRFLRNEHMLTQQSFAG